MLKYVLVEILDNHPKFGARKQAFCRGEICYFDGGCEEPEWQRAGVVQTPREETKLQGDHVSAGGGIDSHSH